jgi:hypothetical protein
MAAMEAKAKSEKKAKKEIDASGGNEYIGAIRENVNKSEEIDASGLDSAIAALDVGACRGGAMGGGWLGCGGVVAVLPTQWRSGVGDGTDTAGAEMMRWRWRESPGPLVAPCGLRRGRGCEGVAAPGRIVCPERDALLPIDGPPR